MKIAILTDSTCDWHLEDYAAHGVTMVPLTVAFGEETFTDQYELSSEQFYDKMIASEALPKSSQPSPHAFSRAFERLAAEGYEGAITLHIAPTLSGTMQAAELAAQTSPIPVKAFDSRAASSKLGLLVDKACELRDAGCDLDEMYDKLVAYRDASQIVLATETLENLVKGGRLPEEQAGQASLLNIRMLFTLSNENGLVLPYDKAKGAQGQIKRCVQFAKDYIDEHGPSVIRIAHARNQGAVDSFVEALKETGAEFELTSVDACGCIIATHLGMGAYAIAIAPRDM